MSTKYTGGFITKSPVAPTTTAASGVWTLDQQQQAQKAGTWPSPPIFIEDLFSTFLYTGTNANQTITNGIDLAGKGGLVWNKVRGATGNNSYHYWVDTARGQQFGIASNSLDTQYTSAAGTDLTAFTSTGYTLGTYGTFSAANFLDASIVSWTFRKQPKFFDIVTYTGDGTTPRNIAHNLGSVPGAIFVKCTSTARDWAVYHRYLGGTQFLKLNRTDNAQTASSLWADTDPSSTTFTVGDDQDTNLSGGTFVAYIFAHDAGGFPVSGGGSTNGISCGTFTTSAGGKLSAAVNLGYEPQFLLVKNSLVYENWRMYDITREMSNASYAALTPNLTTPEFTGTSAIAPTATGFDTPNASGPFASNSRYVYIAIRRGPMKPPTVGTSVFSPQVQTPPGGTSTIAANSGFPIDWLPTRQKNNVTDWYQTSRLTNNYMSPNTTAAETSFTYGFDLMQGVSAPWNATPTVSYAFRRAPGFFDVVCYTGTLANLTLTHNLGVAPEMMIVKCRSSDMPGGIAANWAVYAAPQGNSKFALLNTTDLFGTSAVLWQATTPTASNFYVGAANYVNGSGQTYVAYLFASVAGVSKVGTYTGTGALLTVDCGFTSGARFVLIKRADTSGDWWLYNSASGISSGNDPYLLVNSQAAEVTGTNYVDTDTTGFKVTAAAPAGLNANGGTYIFLAIA